MKKINVTFSLEPKLYQRYRKYAKHKGLIISRQIELMMEEQLK